MFSREGHMHPANWDRARAPSGVQPLRQGSPPARRILWLRGTGRRRSSAVFLLFLARAGRLLRPSSPQDRDRPTEQKRRCPLVRFVAPSPESAGLRAVYFAGEKSNQEEHASGRLLAKVGSAPEERLQRRPSGQEAEMRRRARAAFATNPV